MTKAGEAETQLQMVCVEDQQRRTVLPQGTSIVLTVKLTRKNSNKNENGNSSKNSNDNKTIVIKVRLLIIATNEIIIKIIRVAQGCCWRCGQQLAELTASKTILGERRQLRSFCRSNLRANHGKRKSSPKVYTKCKASPPRS